MEYRRPATMACKVDERREAGAVRVQSAAASAGGEGTGGLISFSSSHFFLATSTRKMTRSSRAEENRRRADGMAADKRIAEKLDGL